MNAFSVPSLICSVLDCSRNLRVIPLYACSPATTKRMTPAMITSTWPAGPVEHAAGRLVRAAAAAAAGADQDRDRRDAEDRVGDAAGEAGDPLLRVVARLRAVAERGAQQPPDRVAREADRHQHEQRLARPSASRSRRARPAGSSSCRRSRTPPGSRARRRSRRSRRARRGRRAPATRTAACARSPRPACCASRTGTRAASVAASASPLVLVRHPHVQCAGLDLVTLNDFTLLRSPPSSS